MTAKIILNPYSNRWTAKKRWVQAAAELKNAGVNFELAVSDYPKHAIALAAEAARAGFDPIIAAGGDGTLGDVLNGLIQADSHATLGLLPIGTGNDLAHAAKISKNLKEAAQIIARGKTIKIDVGVLNNERYFINNSGIGLESYIGKIQEKITWIKGVPRYLVAAVRGMMDRPSWDANVAWEGGSYNGKISLVSIGNGPRSGGMFYMSPHAQLSDGKFTIVHGYRETSTDMLALLPHALKPGAGSYVEKDGVFEVDTPWVKIKLNRPSPWHTDGELSEQDIDTFDYRILPARINILVP